MKKKIIIGIFMLVLVLAAVLYPFLGNVGRAEVRLEESERYSQAEIRHCVNLVKRFFFCNYHGSKLLEIRYDEEFNQRFGDAEAADMGGEEAIILHSDWVNVTGLDGGVPGEQYTGWKWIFVKTPLGLWELTGNGYG